MMYPDREYANICISMLLYKFCVVFESINNHFSVVNKSFVKVWNNDRLSIIVYKKYMISLLVVDYVL